MFLQGRETADDIEYTILVLTFSLSGFLFIPTILFYSVPYVHGHMVAEVLELVNEVLRVAFVAFVGCRAVGDVRFARVVDVVSVPFGAQLFYLGSVAEASAAVAAGVAL